MASPLLYMFRVSTTAEVLFLSFTVTFPEPRTMPGA